MLQVVLANWIIIPSMIHSTPHCIAYGEASDEK